MHAWLKKRFNDSRQTLTTICVVSMLLGALGFGMILVSVMLAR